MRFQNETRSPNTGVIFYFLKPDMNGNLLLHTTVNELPRSSRYISEETLGDGNISLLTRHGGDKYGSKSRNSMRIQWSDDNDRLYNLGILVVKMLGYDMTTTPSVAEILRNTKLQYKKEMDGLLVMDDSIFSPDMASVLGNYYMRKCKLVKSKPKRKIIKRCLCKKRK